MIITCISLPIINILEIISRNDNYLNVYSIKKWPIDYGCDNSIKANTISLADIKLPINNVNKTSHVVNWFNQYTQTLRILRNANYTTNIKGNNIHNLFIYNNHNSLINILNNSIRSLSIIQCCNLDLFNDKKWIINDLSVSNINDVVNFNLINIKKLWYLCYT